MKQPHSEDNIEHTDGEQDTGNHKTPDERMRPRSSFTGWRTFSATMSPASQVRRRSGRRRRTSSAACRPLRIVQLFGDVRRQGERAGM